MLSLPGDRDPIAPSIETFLQDWASEDLTRTAVARVVAAVAEAAVPLAHRLARGELPGDPKRDRRGQHRRRQAEGAGRGGPRSSSSAR